MSTFDLVGYTLICIVLLVGSFRLISDLRSGQEPAIKGEYFVGKEGVAGFQAMAPLTFTGVWATFIGVFLLDLSDSGAARVVAITCFALFAATSFLAISIFLFMRPRFLVIPYLRDQPGWAVAKCRKVRSRRGRATAENRVEPD